ncbi:MAG: trigger factor [Gemmataceae bacterium]|nr:trigger factor [Gemmataceae bacterium]
MTEPNPATGPENLHRQAASPAEAAQPAGRLRGLGEAGSLAEGSTEPQSTPATEPQQDATGSAVATFAEPHAHEHEPEHEREHEHEGEEKKADKLHQSVEMKDVGPCKKHIKVTVERGDIDKRLNEKFGEIIKGANVPGFRPGKAPRSLVTRRYAKDVEDQVKGEILLASLEQLAEDHDVAPLSTPSLDPEKIVIPKEGPFVYEFEVEVRPQFDLPQYKNLKLKRPVRTFTDEDVEQEQRRLLSRYGQLVPKEEGDAQIGDFLIVDMTTRHGQEVIGSAKEVTIKVEERLAFKDGVAEKFGEQVKGAKGGETRVVDITMSDAVANPYLAGRTVEATLEIKDVKKLRLPELTHEFLHNFGVHSVEQFTEQVRALLERRLEYEQRQSAREQVLQHITAASDWELPHDLLMRQARKSLARKVMEMQEAGMSEDEIRGRRRLLEQDVLNNTALALKEHFVLQKIAEEEKIDVDQDDIDQEIERMADMQGVSPRRVRAQLEKDDLLETLAAQLVERKALDLVLQTAEYEDVEIGKAPASGVATVEEQAVEGELKDPTAPPPETPATAEPAPAEGAQTSS